MRTKFIGIVCLFLSSWARAAGLPSTQPINTFVRFTEDGRGGGQMQVAIAQYQNAQGITIDLLSTIHIGDTVFFQTMARRFPLYDVVLYELVAPQGTPPTEEGVNAQQQKIADDCDLENQGPHMNYQRKNFVHADLSLEEIQTLETDKHGTFKGALGEGPGLTAARDERNTAGQHAVFADLQAAKTAKLGERVRLLRRAYSRVLAFTAQPAPGQTYPAQMEVLVGARNDQVMRVLNEQLGAGKKKIAIFYGAAHMVDLEHRLFVQSFSRISVKWDTAWAVADDPLKK